MLADSAFYQVKRLVIRQPDMFSIIKNNQTMEKDDMDKDMNNLEDKPQVLILENDPALRKVMEISLEQVGVRVAAVGMHANVEEMLQQNLPEVFILDIDMPDGEPDKLMTAYREHQASKVGTVMISTVNRLEDNWRRKHRPDTVIYKPFDMRYLVRKILSLINEHRFYQF
jgi:DNA-binding response OmpR family regulator